MDSRPPQVFALRYRCERIGSISLQRRLRTDGHGATPVVRHAPADGEIGSSIEEQRIDDGSFDGIDAVIHLAGAGVGSWRWTGRYSARFSAVVRSAPVSLRRRSPRPEPARGPGVSSAVGFYGASLDDTFTDDDTAEPHSSANVCQAWESAATAAETPATRVAVIRTGYRPVRPRPRSQGAGPAHRFASAAMWGSGNQRVSWIHIDDEVGAIVHLLTSQVSGPVNLTAPIL